MKKRRRSYTHKEAQEILSVWLAKRGMTTMQFVRWLDERGITITRQYCKKMAEERLTPGPKFKQVFREITGIQLVDGLVEADRERAE